MLTETRLEGARSLLDSIGRDGVRVISQRLDVLVSGAGQLKALLQEHEDASGRLPELFAVASNRIKLDVRALGEEGAATTARLTHDLNAVGAQLADVHAVGEVAMGALTGAIGKAHAKADDLAGLLAKSHELVTGVNERLGDVAR